MFNLRKKNIQAFLVLEKIAVKKHHLYFIESALSWLYDLISLHKNLKQNLFFKERQEELNRVYKEYGLEDLLSACDLLIETEVAMDAFANKKLALEGLYIRWQKIFINKGVIV